MIFVDAILVRPADMSLISMRVVRQVDYAPYEEGEDPVAEMERNLIGLIKGILEYTNFDEIPLRYQRHTVGVPG